MKKTSRRRVFRKKSECQNVQPEAFSQMMVECFRCGRGRRCFCLPIRGKFWLKLLFSILITLFQGAGPRGEGGGGRSVWNSRNGRAESVERFWIDYVKGSDKTLGRHGIYRSCFVSKTLKTGESSSF